MQVMKWSVIALAVAAGSTQMAVASSQSESKGFAEDSSLRLLNKNYYFNRDFRNNAGSGNNSYRKEWAHGISAMYESGFTQGTVGFGVDAHAALGLKLDSGRGSSGTGLLPVDSNGRAEDEHSYVGGAVKLQVSNTVLKYGSLMPTAPVFATATARLFPATATGFQLLSNEIEDLTIDAGHFTSTRDGSASTSRDGEIVSSYSGVASDSVDYLGGSYGINDQLSVSLYASEYEDVWRQYYGNTNYNIPFSDTQALNLDFNIYRTLDQGSAKAGQLANTAWSLAAAYSVGGHKFTLAHQRVHGDEPMDYVNMDGVNFGDSIFLANSSQYSDFNSPNERSWQARYDLSMTEYGVPGLSFMARYITGDDADGTKADPNGAFAGAYGSDGKQWERDLEVKYVVQEGAAKDLSFRVRHATWRANKDLAFAGSGGATALDEIRLITEYPLDIL